MPPIVPARAVAVVRDLQLEVLDDRTANAARRAVNLRDRRRRLAGPRSVPVMVDAWCRSAPPGPIRVRRSSTPARSSWARAPAWPGRFSRFARRAIRRTPRPAQRHGRSSHPAVPCSLLQQPLVFAGSWSCRKGSEILSYVTITASHGISSADAAALLIAIARARARVAGCNSAAGGRTPRRPAESAGAAAAQRARRSSGCSRRRKTCLPFTMTDIDGRTFSSADWRGKVVLINFWATWCPPCRAEIPDLIALQKKYSDKLVIIGVSEDDIPVAGGEAVRRRPGHELSGGDDHARDPEDSSAASRRCRRRSFSIARDGSRRGTSGMLNPVGTEAETRVLAGLDTTTKVERDREHRQGAHRERR